MQTTAPAPSTRSMETETVGQSSIEGETNQPPRRIKSREKLTKVREDRNKRNRKDIGHRFVNNMARDRNPDRHNKVEIDEPLAREIQDFKKDLFPNIKGKYFD